MFLPHALLIIAVTVVGPPTSIRPILLKGKVLAIHWAQFAMNGNVDPAILVEVEAIGSGRTEVVLIHGSVIESKFQEWLKSLETMNKFEVIRTSKSDFVLTEFAPVLISQPGSTLTKPGNFPIWRQLNGKPLSNLPFGAIIKDYQSIEWPQVPIL